MVTKINIYTLIILLMSVIVNAQSDTFTSETAQDYTVNWTMIADQSNYKEYIVTVTNLQNVARNFDLRLITDQFGNNGLDFDINVYEYKDITKETTTYNNICDTTEQFINSTFINVTLCFQTTYTVYTKLGQWKETQNPEKIKNNGAMYKDYGYINIPKTTSKAKLDDYGNIITQSGTKTFRVIIKNFNPIIYSARLGFIEKTTNQLYHPLVSSTLYTANFITDQATTSNMVQDTNTLNTSSLLGKNSLTYHTFDFIDMFNTSNGSRDFQNRNNLTNQDTSNQSDGFVNQARTLVKADTEFLSTNSFEEVNKTFTISIAVRPASHNTETAIISLNDPDGSGGAANNLLEFRLLTNGSIQIFGFETGQAICGGANQLRGGNLIDTTWNMLTMTINETICNFYINDSLVASTSSGNRSLALFDELNIGVNEGVIIPFDGDIDTLGIWSNESLNQTRISEYFNGGEVIQANFSRTEPWSSVVFNTGDNHDRFIPTFDVFQNCNLSVTSEGEQFNNIPSGVQQFLLTTPVDGANTFNITVFCGGSSLQNLNLSFSTGAAPPINVTPVDFTINSVECVQFEGACFDGVNKCVLVNDTRYSGDFDNFDVKCNDFAFRDSFLLIGLLFLFGILFLLSGYVFKIPAFAIVGAFILLFLGIGLLPAYTIYASLLILIMIAILFSILFQFY